MCHYSGKNFKRISRGSERPPRVFAFGIMFEHLVCIRRLSLDALFNPVLVMQHQSNFCYNSSGSLDSRANRFLPEAATRFEAGSWYCWRFGLDVDSPEGKTCLRLAVDSKYWLWVNGECVVREGGLKRGPTPRDSYVDQVDISDYLSDSGSNLIAIHHWYFGRVGFSHQDSGAPELNLEVLGDRAALSHCKVMRDAGFFDAGNVRPGTNEGNRLAESSVGFDSRKDMGDWQSQKFDDSAWNDPFVLNSGAECYLGALVDRPIPQFKWSQPVDRPADDWSQETGGYRVYRLDLPHNMQCLPRLNIESLEGLKIQILSDSPTHVLTAEYITMNGSQAWESPAWLNGHRLLFRIPEDVTVISLGYRETSYMADTTGSFCCDDESLNDLWVRSARTLKVTMRDSFMDCPCRERAQWWGDEVIQLGQLSYCLEPSAHQLVSKGIYELASWQCDDGKLYSPIPSGNWNKELPLQMLASIGRYGFAEYYVQTNDFTPLEVTFNTVLNYLKLWQEDGRSLPKVREGDWNWGDWGANQDMVLLTAGWLILAWDATAQTAMKLGEDSIAGDLTARVYAMRETVRLSCRVEGGFRYQGHLGSLDDRANALMVLSGVAEEIDYPNLSSTLFSVRHASPYMEKYVLEALFAIGRPELGLVRMRERYSGMLETGSTTLWEFFPENGFENNTNNHSWSGAPLIILSRFVAGLYPAKAGWIEMGFRPQPAGLNHYKVQFETPFGRVSSEYTHHGDSFKLQLTVPDQMGICFDLTGISAGASVCLESGDGETSESDLRGKLSGGTWTVTGVR